MSQGNISMSALMGEWTQKDGRKVVGPDSRVGGNPTSRP